MERKSSALFGEELEVVVAKTLAMEFGKELEEHQLDGGGGQNPNSREGGYREDTCRDFGEESTERRYSVLGVGGSGLPAQYLELGEHWSSSPGLQRMRSFALGASGLVAYTVLKGRCLEWNSRPSRWKRAREPTAMIPYKSEREREGENMAQAH